MVENASDGKLLMEEGVRKNLRFDIQHVENIELEKTARTLSAIIHDQGISSKIRE